MADTLIKIDLHQSPYDNAQVHNHWHPDIPMAAMVKPGDDFIIECHDWTGGQIHNDDSAEDVRDVDLSQVHFLSGPVGVEGAEPGDLLVVDILDIGAFGDSQWGFNGFDRKPDFRDAAKLIKNDRDLPSPTRKHSLTNHHLTFSNIAQHPNYDIARIALPRRCKPISISSVDGSV